MPLLHVSHDPSTGIARLRLQRPAQRNAINVALAMALRDAVTALQHLASTGQLRVVGLEGEGAAFCAGGDLAAFAADPWQAGAVAEQLLDALEPALIGLRALPVPVVASVHGAVAGAGLGLMGACDLVLAADGTRFLAGYDRIAAAPDCGVSAWMASRLRPAEAARFYFSGEVWSAQQALSLGLVHRLVAAESRAPAFDDWLAELACGPTRAFAETKALLLSPAPDVYARQLAAERRAFLATAATADFRAGIAAFLAGSAPTFTGC